MDSMYGDMVRMARRSADLSQRQLAGAAGVAPTTVARVESGRTQPSAAMLQRLLLAAGCELVLRRADGSRPVVLHDGRLRDGQGRRYPAHLDITLPPYWRHRIWPPGCKPPPVSYQRDRKRRDRLRWAGHVDPRVVPTPPELYGHRPAAAEPMQLSRVAG